MKKITVISWGFTIALMALIFFFSSQTAVESSEVSESIVDRLARFLASISGISSQVIGEGIHKFVRKVAHFVLYTVFGFSMCNSVSLTRGGCNFKSLLIAFVCAVFYAVTDEVHQMFVAGRSGEVRDVFIDTLGILAGSLVSVMVFGFFRKKRCSK